MSEINYYDSDGDLYNDLGKLDSEDYPWWLNAIFAMLGDNDEFDWWFDFTILLFGIDLETVGPIDWAFFFIGVALGALIGGGNVGTGCLNDMSDFGTALYYFSFWSYDYV